MTQGQLGDYFEGVAWKRLSIVETNPERSNQREFNGIIDFKEILGSARRNFSAHFFYFGDKEEDICRDQGTLTWYDARKDDLKRSEHRLYFPKISVTEKAEAGDLLIIGRRPDDSLMMVIAKEGTSFESQMFWLFGIPDDLWHDSGVRFIEGNEQIGFAAGLILEELGIEVVSESDEWLFREMLERFNGEFPSTRVFSEFARETMREPVDDTAVLADPDNVLISWIDHEKSLFKALEQHIVWQRIQRDFKDVDEFISYSLSVQNRRKSRAGLALENHLEFIFKRSHIKYSRNKKTENNMTPDFLFPGIGLYHDEYFPYERLSMLAVKSTCKDRWRQALAEAERIDRKHLLTLEPSISINQTHQMRESNLQLVVPKDLHQTYKPEQQPWLMDLNSFIHFVKEKQEQF